MQLPISFILALAGGSLYGHLASAFSKQPSFLRSPSCSLSASATPFSETIDHGPRWKPKVKSLQERRRLRGLKHNTEAIGSLRFHHIEFWCGDAKSTAQQFAQALGMSVTGTTGQHTGNDQCVSYGLQSGDVRFLLTAPYSQRVSSSSSSNSNQNTGFDAPHPLPGYDPADSHAFFAKHGLAARAIGLEVRSAKDAFDASVERGAEPVLEPTVVPACRAQTNIDQQSQCEMAEVKVYGDVVLRFVSFGSEAQQRTQQQQSTKRMPFLPHLAPTSETQQQRPSFGLERIDHAVGNVPNLAQALEHIAKFTGFHEFAEFTPEDIGTLESGLNSVVLASDSEDVLLPLNEPTEGKRKSQILTYLEQNEGAGLQHLALKTNDIFETIVHMRRAEDNFVGFELMRRPSDGYYRELPDRLGDQLTPDQYQRLEELGILADADDEGILLQLFTKPVGDRPTFFFEIIQRIGCQYTPDDDNDDSTQQQDETGENTALVLERPGCGGFGQGNFRELFKSIEDYEKTLRV